MKKSFLIFPMAVIAIYVIILPFDPAGIERSILSSCNIFINILPVIPFIIILMGIFNYVFKPKKVERWLGRESGLRGWLITLSFGLLSHGPMYLWYPLLRDLSYKGMKNSLISAFLYSRSVKIPLIPILILYFGPLFTILLILFTLFGAILEGKILEYIVDRQG